jgi:hypothetical protein
MATATQERSGSTGSNQAGRESKSQMIADRIVELLGKEKDKTMGSAELHEKIQKEFETSGLYGARQILADRVQTGVRVEGKACWKLVK